MIPGGLRRTTSSREKESLDHLKRVVRRALAKREVDPEVRESGCATGSRHPDEVANNRFLAHGSEHLADCQHCSTARHGPCDNNYPLLKLSVSVNELSKRSQ